MLFSMKTSIIINLTNKFPIKKSLKIGQTTFNRKTLIFHFNQKVFNFENKQIKQPREQREKFNKKF